MTYWPHSFGYEKSDPNDFSLNLNQKPKILRPIYLFGYFIKSLFTYDVFIFLFGDTFWLFKNRYFTNLDLPILKLFNRKIVMVFVGCDIRYRHSQHYCCQGCQIKCDNRLKKQVALGAQKYADLILAQEDYAELLGKAKYNNFWIPFNLNQYRPSYATHSRPIVLHAPSDRGMKGTKHLQKAVLRLKKEGLRFQFKIMEKKPHHVILEELERADIVVDSLYGGWYGVFAAESLAFGKVVLGYLNPEVIRKKHLNPPMISVDPKNIYEKLKMVLKMKPEDRLAQAKKGRRFIENYHDGQKIVKKILRNLDVTSLRSYNEKRRK